MPFERDRATEELVEAIDQSRGQQRLWVADEHPLSDAVLATLADKNLYLISNRRDQVRRAREAGVRAAFSDFDLHHPDNSLWDSIYFRVAKEKAVVHHVLNSAARSLRERGTFWLSGHKDEGTKTYLCKSEELFGCKAMVKRCKDQLFIGQLDLYQRGEPLEDQDYEHLRQVQMSETETFWSKPGLYGWNRIDQGSQFLVETLANLDIDLVNSKVLDLGCGYGYLSIKAIEMGCKNVVATDNCAAAISACQKNLASFTTGQFKSVSSDCADEVGGQFDLILCNPPFHTGFNISSDLHLRFLNAIKNKLNRNGRALVVVNQFLRLQQLCEETGLKIVERRRDGKRHFDVYQIERQI